MDREAIGSLNDPERSLMRLAFDRGFDRLSSVYYFDARELDYGSSSAAIAAELHAQYEIPRSELDQFSFRVDYRSSDRRFAGIEMALADAVRPGIQGRSEREGGSP